MITNDAKLVKALAYAEHVKKLGLTKALKEEQIAHLRDSLGMSAQAIGEKVATSSSADRLPDGIARLRELISDYTTDLIGYVQEIAIFNVSIQELDPAQAQALHLRYIGLKEWKQIADQMGYSEQRIYQLRAEGLTNLYDLMPEEFRSQEIPNAI